MSTHKSQAPDILSIALILGGQVQGVGFRPFVYRLAHAYNIQGWVQNRSGEVRILAQGDAGQLEHFITALVSQAPPLSHPLILDKIHVTAPHSRQFTIMDSKPDSKANIHIPTDYFTCNDCLQELSDQNNRRYHYPFINCTQCGPRYTLIKQLPYDRANTTMAAFTLCSDCQREYQDPLDRRFHAEPVACPACGPRLEFQGTEGIITDNDAAINMTISALRNGQVIAVKGIGGYHLLCDARNELAIQHLRQQKNRPHKPLAVMFPLRGEDGLDALRHDVVLDKAHEKMLLDPIRPIILCQQKSTSSLASQLAPGLNEMGVMLPYSPLHFLLLDQFDAPLIATSANISGEPVLTDPAEATQRLAAIAQGFLHHNRPIQRPADDPLYHVVQERPRAIRLGRGNAPLELSLPFTLDNTLLAVGGHMKNTIALAWENRVVISPHIGELGSPKSLMVFEQLISDLQSLYQISVDKILCDAHPAYASTKWAKNSGLPYQEVFHHHAHASALTGEYPTEENWLVFTWDGVGYGMDGTLWGGESFYGQAGNWQRKTSFRPFYLPGGEKASRQPWRSALSLCWETNTGWDAMENTTNTDLELLQQAWRQKLNCPQTTAAGRLFDAASALTGLVMDTSFEGQGPMLLETVARGKKQAPVTLPLSLDEDNIWRSDWSTLIPMLLNKTRSIEERANCFHTSMAANLLDQARLMREQHGHFAVGLGGGVFQNRLLTDMAIELLEENGFNVYLPTRVPCNDGGLCFGQIIEGGRRPEDQIEV